MSFLFEPPPLPTSGRLILGDPVGGPSDLDAVLDHAEIAKSAALAWAGRGFRVFPTQAKVPLTDKDWRQVASADPTVIAAFDWTDADGYGVALHDHHVIDLDVKAAPLADVTEDLERLAPDLEPTLVVETPSGGRHYYFAAPDGVELSQRSPVPRRVDIRVAGKGYVCGPGAGGYGIVRDAEAAPLPPSLCDRLVAPPAREKVELDRIGEIEDERPTTERAAWALVERHAERMRRAEKGSRNDTLNTEAFQAGRALPALDADDVVEAMVEAALETGLDREEAHRHAVRGVEAGARTPMPPSGRSATAEEAFEGVPRPDADHEGGHTSAPAPSLPGKLGERERDALANLDPEARAQLEKYLADFLTTRQLLEQEPREFIVEGLIMERTSHNWCGGPGSYKSWMLLQLAYALATGAPDVVGFKINRACRVVYFDAENAGLNDRHEAMVERYGHPPPDGLLTRQTPALLASDDQFELMLAALKIIRPAVVIIDTKAKSTVGLKENDASDMGQVWARVDRIKEELGAAVITATHTGKNGEQRGSTADVGDADALFVQSTAGRGKVKLTIKKLRTAPVLQPEVTFHAVNTGPGITFEPKSHGDVDADEAAEANRDALAKDLQAKATADKIHQVAAAREASNATMAAVMEYLREQELLVLSEAHDHSDPPLPAPIDQVLKATVPKLGASRKSVREAIYRATRPSGPHAALAVDASNTGRPITLRLPPDQRPTTTEPEPPA